MQGCTEMCIFVEMVRVFADGRRPRFPLEGSQKLKSGQSATFLTNPHQTSCCDVSESGGRRRGPVRGGGVSAGPAPCRRTSSCDHSSSLKRPSIFSLLPSKNSPLKADGGKVEMEKSTPPLAQHIASLSSIFSLLLLHSSFFFF